MIPSVRPYKKLDKATGKWITVAATPTPKEVANTYISRVDFKRSGFDGSIEKMIEKQSKYKKKQRKKHDNGRN